MTSDRTPERRSGQGFWSSVSRRAKAAFSEDGTVFHHPDLERQQNSPGKAQARSTDPSQRSRSRVDNSPSLQKRFEALSSSLSQLGGSLGNAIEEGFTLVEAKASSLMSLDRLGRSPSRKKYADSSVLPMYSGEEASVYNLDDIIQLKASHDLAVAMGNKSKQEVKIVKAELEYLRDHCTQLEEENRKLKELMEKGMIQEEDDLVRMQLEALHLEKSRLANENENYARENRFLRELMEYHQLTLQDVSLDDNTLEPGEDNGEQKQEGTEVHITV